MRIVDVLYAIPYMMIVIVLLAFFGGQSPLGQLVLLFVALGAVSWLTMARIVRGQVISLKNQEFMLAARATGVPRVEDHRAASGAEHAGPGDRLRHADHSVGHAARGVPLVSRARRAGAARVVGQPVRRRHRRTSPSSRGSCSVPGITMAITLFSLNFLGDGLRDALDPQMRKADEVSTPLLSVRDLRTYFDEDGRVVQGGGRRVSSMSRAAKRSASSANRARASR